MSHIIEWLQYRIFMLRVAKQIADEIERRHLRAGDTLDVRLLIGITL